MEFKKAVRTQTKLKVAITGPSGSGKTYSALVLAQSLGKRIALIDTENGSASLYADRFEFDTLSIEPPYTVVKYLSAMELAEKAGYEVIVVDSLSHAWAAEGGLLQKKEALDSRGGNSYTNWGAITKEHEKFKAKILNTQTHMICTMRSKQDYVLEINEKGKQSPKKVGMAPIQRDGMEYEFTLVFDIGMDHSAAVSKDRTGLFDGFLAPIDAKTGELILHWWLGAAPAIAPPPKRDPLHVDGVSGGEWKPSAKQLGRLYTIVGQSRWEKQEVMAYMAEHFKKASSKDLDVNEYNRLCAHLLKNPKPISSTTSAGAAPEHKEAAGAGHDFLQTSSTPAPAAPPEIKPEAPAAAAPAPQKNPRMEKLRFIATKRGMTADGLQDFIWLCVAKDREEKMTAADFDAVEVELLSNDGLAGSVNVL